MTEEDDRQELLGTLLGIASGVRKVVVHGNKRITEVIAASTFDESYCVCLLEYIEMYMSGADKDVIFDALQVSPELATKLERHFLAEGEAIR